MKEWLLRLDTFFLWYFVLVNGFSIVLLILGSLKVYFRKRELSVQLPPVSSRSLPQIGFIVPLYNDEAHIVATVNTLLHLSYPNKQITVVNDGSTDGGFALLKERYDLVKIHRALYRSQTHSALVVIDKRHEGKAEALNAGIQACTSEYVIGVDADTIVDNNAFEAYIRPLLLESNLIAVGGTISVGNDCVGPFSQLSTERFPQTFITGVQSLEYLRAFLTRQGWDYAGGNFIIAGAFCLFPRDLLIEVGGFIASSGEDMEIVMRLHRIMRKRKTPYKIFYLPDPIAWTQAPADWKTLGRQRTRWHLGLFESLFFHRAMCGNPLYGRLAFITYPFWLLGEALEPIMELLGFVLILLSLALGILHLPFFLLFLNVTFVFTCLFTLTCLFIEELSFQRWPSSRSILALCLYTLFENFGYRQLCLWWKLRSCYQFCRKFSEIKKTSARIETSLAISSQRHNRSR
jgi:cellulose synthase/poly-beta-1,6-N-acetylglucosamine synthase-like glycosyltransferase